MKITLYTIKDCAFSKQEKEYLNTNKLVFEEKDLETNKDFLTEMLAISNNFAGTPVTRVEKDDGSIAVLKGFTKEEFDTTFGLAAAPTVSEPTNQAAPPVNDTPIPPVVEAVPSPTETVTPAPAEASPQPVNPLTVEPNNPSPTEPDPLKSVMDDLQTKSQPTDQPIQPFDSAQGKPTTTDLSAEASAKADSTASPTLPNIPEPDFK